MDRHVATPASPSPAAHGEGPIWDAAAGELVWVDITAGLVRRGSIRNRFPYLEPLHHLQVEMLRRRRGGDDDELVRRCIQLSVNGVATALRNSG